VSPWSGFDDFPRADLLQPRVTVVAQDPAAIGRTAASLVFRRLDGEHWPPAEHLVPVELIPRLGREPTRQSECVT
jgi:LacI family transcriptional regulator